MYFVANFSLDIDIYHPNNDLLFFKDLLSNILVVSQNIEPFIGKNMPKPKSNVLSFLFSLYVCIKIILLLLSNKCFAMILHYFKKKNLFMHGRTAIFLKVITFYDEAKNDRLETLL